MHTSLLRLPDVQRRTGLSRSSIYSMVQARDFPAPIKLVPNGKTSAWIESEVEDFIARRIAASRNGSKEAA